MTAKDGEGLSRCWLCRDRVLEVRPVCIHGREEPAGTCALCHGRLEDADMIDGERDAEVFGYAD